jgi:hypothetical protein
MRNLDAEQYNKYLYEKKYKQDDPTLTDEQKFAPEGDLPKDHKELMKDLEKEYDDFWQSQNQGDSK